MRQNQLVPFEFEDHQVRVAEQADTTWFVAGDAARILGYRDAADLTRILDQDEKGTQNVRTLGGPQSVSVVSEPGLYRAIIQRRAGEALPAEIVERITRFQRWVYHDVLPSIRRTGTYTVPGAVAVLPAPKNIADTFRSYFGIARLIGMDRNQAALGASRATMKATGVDPLVQIEATHLLAPQQERHITPTEIAKQLEAGSAKVANALLERHGFQTSARDPKGKLVWTPTDTGRPFAIILDTGKSQGGAPIRQLRWSADIVAALQAAIGAADATPSSTRRD